MTMLEENTRSYLTDILMDVPLARGQGNPIDHLTALLEASLFYPVFQNWQSPVDSWLEEAEKMAQALKDSEVLALLGIRRAVIMMRRNELDSALTQLDRVVCPPSLVDCQVWSAVTRARILTRQQKFEAAQQALNGLPKLPPDNWIAPLPLVASGELQLEQNQIDSAEMILKQSWTALPDHLVEERVQVLQSLGFIAISRTDIKMAFTYLDQARQILRGAGIWSEVIQMNLVVGNFHISLNQPRQAKPLLEEALALAREHQQPQFETLVQLGLSRLKIAQGKFDEAINANLQASTLFAQQGNVLGYTSMIVQITRIYIHQKRFAEAYRTLVTGLSIAKHLKLTRVEAMFRSQIDTLRDEIMGQEAFNKMVDQELSRARSAKLTDRKN